MKALLPTNRGFMSAESICDRLTYECYKRERIANLNRPLEVLAQAFGDESVIFMEQQFQSEMSALAQEAN